MSERNHQADVQEGLDLDEQAEQEQNAAAQAGSSEAEGPEPGDATAASWEATRQQITEELSDQDAQETLEAADELADRAAELDLIKAELDETRDQLMRQAASFQNYRRRTQQEFGRIAEQAKAEVVRQVLDVLDDLQRTLEAAQEAERQDEPDYEKAHRSLQEGVELVYQKFMGELKRLGVEPIEAEGQPFDENEHEAMLQQPGPEDMPAGMVLQELQRGYRMGNRVLRHSKVIVSS